MILYDNRSWLGLIFRFRGTVLTTTWRPIFLVLCASLLVWLLEVEFPVEFGASGNTIFGPTMCYLLVFRANNASQRYWLGRGYLTRMFIALREFIMLMCVGCLGGEANMAWRMERASEERRREVEDIHDARVSMARINIIRLALAFTVSVKLHTRIAYDGLIRGQISGEQKRLIDWDRLRIRGLVSRQEFEELNDLIPILQEKHVSRGAAFLTPDMIEEILSAPREAHEVDTAPDMRMPLALIVKLRLEIMRHINEWWGFKERFAKDFLFEFNEAGRLFEHISALISTPIPFPYVHLCKVLLLGFVISMPLTVDASQGFLGAVVIPTLVAMSLLGIDAIALELENPFGDKPNHLELDSLIHQLEEECMLLLELCGDFRAKEAFRYLEIPRAVQGVRAKIAEEAGYSSASEDDALLSNHSEEELPPMFLSLRTQIRVDDDSPMASFDDIPAFGASFGDEGSLKKRTNFDIPEVEIPKDDADWPLPEKLTPAGSETSFKPMKEFGTETLVFTEEGDEDAGGGSGQDFVDLDLDARDVHEEGEEEPPRPLSPLAGGTPTLSMHSSNAHFLPMGSMASGTVVLEGEDDASRAAQDAIGLDDMGSESE